MAAKTLRNNILSVVISLALSFCLWMALSGQDMSVVDFTVPLELTGLSPDLVVKNDLPTSVTFQVLANTAQVRFLSDRKPHLRLDGSLIKEGHNVIAVEPESLDLPRGVTVRAASPSSVEVMAARVLSKTVPVQATVRGHPDTGFELVSVVVTPPEATIRGPEEDTAAIDKVITMAVDIEGYSADTTVSLRPDLSEMGPTVTVSPTEFQVFLNLEERMAEKTFSDLPIALEVAGGNLPASAVVLSPPKATISVAWPVSARLGLEASALKVRVVIDGRRLAEEGGEMELPVLVTPPANVKVTAIEPVNVTVTAPGLVGLSPGAKALPEGGRK